MQKRSGVMNDYRFSAVYKGRAQIGSDRPGLDMHASETGTPWLWPMLYVDDRAVFAHQPWGVSEMPISTMVDKVERR